MARIYKCSKCGSEDVTAATKSEWSVRRQEWVAMMIESMVCRNCGNKGIVEEFIKDCDEADRWSEAYK